ncbi:MAG: hypothetical protein V1708_01790 [Candidatus Micrarchaeota archaeon]
MVVVKIDVSCLSYEEIAELAGRFPKAAAVFTRFGGHVVLQMP